ncbi:hypothetical protein SLS58_005216 [Diplodia intermedia]|uniref:YDG domain-containing protein n=1 Tax=Diplodia intermedia TaxID=856260 RepID=A0ABR3TS13_9PEZI
MSPSFSKEVLRQRACWIRDDLDPRISRDGPECMQPDDVLTLHELFLGLQNVDLSISVLRYSRIHVAVLEVSGKATRWPKRLAEECDKVIELWTKKYGKLSDIRPRLFNPDGRLYGVCTGRELTRDALVKFWSQQDPSYMSPDRAMQHGSLGFKAGDWWINGTFAFHAGVIDLNCTDGGICANKHGAYAIVMKDNDEQYTETPDKFKYRCKSNDPGRFRMTSADFKSRYPIRVLRSHTLNSLWAPRTGIRYEGLTTGWTIKPADPAENGGSNLVWEIGLERDYTLEDEDAQISSLKHPTAEETDDYMEYKRYRKEMLHKVRERILTGIPAKIPSSSPAPPAIPEMPAIEIQSPPMSPKTEMPVFVGDYCLMRELVLPGSPETPPLTRTSFFQPPPSLRAQTGPAKPQRETQPQPRSLTVPQNPRKSRSNLSADARAQKPRGEKKSATPSQKMPDISAKSSIKDFARAPPGSRDSKNSIAKSFTRIFSDGAFDKDIPESPFGSVLAGYDNGEPSSYPFDQPLPIPSLPPSATTSASASVGGSTPPSEKGSNYNKNPILRQVHWGTIADANNVSARQHPSLSTNKPKQGKPRHRQRRDRAVYEAFDRQAESADPRLLLAALDEVWDECAEPEYPDMVLEEPAVYESSSGYSGGFGSDGGGIGIGSGGPAQRSRSDDYMLRIPPGGVDVERFIAQQAAGGDGGGAALADPGARRSWHGGDEPGGAASSSAHEIGSRLREMAESSAAGPDNMARLQSQRLSSGSASASGSIGAGGSGAWVAPDNRRRRSSLGAFDSRMPSWTPEDAGGMAALSRRLRRPTIVLFSGRFKRQSLEETVDEVVDEGVSVEEVVAKGSPGLKKGKERQGRSDAVSTEVMSGGFGDEPL